MTVELRADCSACRALCCVVLPFDRGADFPFAKAAGQPCRHLAGDHRCTIHDRLAERGFRGCVTYDCFGAGQRATRAADPAAAFARLRVLHELLWYLRAARSWPAAAELRPELDEAIATTEALADGALAEGAYGDVHDQRAAAARLLRRASELARGPGAPDRSHADLAGRDLRRTDLAGTSLRGAVLIAADLRGARLHLTDLLGADLRNADLRGADVSTALYLTQAQANAARGDAATRLPDSVDRPAHWITTR